MYFLHALNVLNSSMHIQSNHVLCDKGPKNGTYLNFLCMSVYCTDLIVIGLWNAIKIWTSDYNIIPGCMFIGICSTWSLYAPHKMEYCWVQYSKKCNTNMHNSFPPHTLPLHYTCLCPIQNFRCSDITSITSTPLMFRHNTHAYTYMILALSVCPIKNLRCPDITSMATTTTWLGYTISKHTPRHTSHPHDTCLVGMSYEESLMSRHNIHGHHHSMTWIHYMCSTGSLYITHTPTPPPPHTHTHTPTWYLPCQYVL